LKIVASRGRLGVLRRLLDNLPRLGLLNEACQLLETAQQMEARHPVGIGAITEFDAVFEIGCEAIARCLVVSSADWPSAGRKASRRRSDAELVDYMEQLVEVLLRCWLTHSRRVRLSVLESVGDPEHWNRLKGFIERYGGDLFTQRFLNLGNLRGILHQGTAEYLKTLRNEPEPEEPFRLLAELDSAISLDEAAQWLGTTLEAVVENYGEYIDYNSITTQSDRGELLYTLLDFLRLEAGYDRLAWNLRPVLLVHQVLVRCGREEAAAMWRGMIAGRTAPIADEHLRRFERLCAKYGMRLPSIAEHLAERFVRPLEVDRLCALIRPAIDDLRHDCPSSALRQLEEQIDRFTAEPPGAGYELPGWLDALEQELDRVEYDESDEEDATFDPHVRVPQVRLSRDEFLRQMQQMLRDGPEEA